MSGGRNQNLKRGRRTAFAKRFIPAIAVLAFLAVYFLVIKPPKTSNGFPTDFVQDLVAGGVAIPVHYAPSAVYLCVVGGYQDLTDFLSQHGIEAEIGLDTGESDFAFVFEFADGSVEHFLNRYRTGYPIIARKSGCYQADGYIFELSDPQEGYRNPATRLLSITLRPGV